MGNERTVRCPKCGNILRRINMNAERYKNLGIEIYNTRCDLCDITVEIEDRSSFEQEGQIKITFT